MRGLPWSATPQDIREFFNGLEISQDGIVLARNGDGRVTGEAYVLFCDEDNFQRAMTRNREHIGKRYIELFKSSGEEMELALKRAIASPASQPRPKLNTTRQRLNSSHSVDFSGRFHGEPPPLWEVTPTISLPFQGLPQPFSSNPTSPILPALWMPERVDETWLKAQLAAKKQHDSATPLPSTIMDCVQLRGLPYSASRTQVLEFFAGLTLGEGGIHFIYDGSGRPTGNGYVHFGSVEDAIKATEKHKHHMGNRYIEVFRCPRIEMINAVGPFRFNLPQNPWSPSTAMPMNGSSGAGAHPELLSPNTMFPSSPSSFSPVVLPPGPSLSWEQQNDLTNSAYALDQAAQNLLKTQQSWPRMSTFSPDNSSSSANYCSPSKVKADPISSALLSPHVASTQSSPINDLHLDFIRSLSQVSVQDNNPTSLTSEQIADNLFSALPNFFNSDSFLTGNSADEQRSTSWSDGLTSATQSRSVVKMRGIPYNTDKFEILNFFSGFNLTENDIFICYNDDMKPTGEAYVNFTSLEDAQRAVVEKDRKHIGPRYVELFLDR